MKIKNHLWKIIAFVLIVELENLWHSTVAVLAHGYLNEQALCETGKTHPITRDVHHPWGRNWSEIKVGEGQGSEGDLLQY